MRPQSSLSVVSRLCLALLVLLPPVAGAQAAPGIFVTPVAGAPFSGTVMIQRTVLQPDGTQMRLWSERQIGRDNAGRIYSEFRPLRPQSDTAPPPLQRVLIYDPQSRMSVSLFPQNKLYRMVILKRPPRVDTPEDFASPSAQAQPPSQFTHTLDLGYKTIFGLQAHGVRVNETLPASESGTGSEVIVSDEYWYSEDLRINLRSIHSDPRTGTVQFTLTGINRTAPSENLFAVPADYKMAGMTPAH